MDEMSFDELAEKHWDNVFSELENEEEATC